MNAETRNTVTRLVSKLIDRQLHESESAELNELLLESDGARKLYHELLDNHEALCSLYPGAIYEASLDDAAVSDGTLPNVIAGSSSLESPAQPPGRFTPSSLKGTTFAGRLSDRGLLAIAAAMLFVVGLVGYFLGQGRMAPDGSKLGGDSSIVKQSLNVDGDEPTNDILDGQLGGNEQTIAGHATLRRSVDLVWTDGASVYRDGDVLPNGLLQFGAGTAEIDFFCGATLIVEGPAVLDVESDWVVRVAEGRLRANVPPAARGFVVKAAGSEIIDLGTEFALEVGAENARVEVIDGEVELRGGLHDGNHLLTGQRQWLRGTEQTQPLQKVSSRGDLHDRHAGAGQQQFENWRQHSLQLRSDERLIAYYPIVESDESRDIVNASQSGHERDGISVGPVERTTGRFGTMSAGLRFGRPGARVRTRLDGEFSALTFVSWVRIDSLDHIYNALFMADGYENGEPHWQIRNDGRLMLSVMVDNNQPSTHFSKSENRIVSSAGLARVYYSEPIWDISKSGQWFHLAAVYDPAGRRVVQYVNGKQVGSESINDKFHVSELRIGPSEIGNWGQPFRKTPAFAVRNLDGTIDEMALFNAALSPEEIQNLYQQGKPIGY